MTSLPKPAVNCKSAWSEGVAEPEEVPIFVDIRMRQLYIYSRNVATPDAFGPSLEPVFLRRP